MGHLRLGRLPKTHRWLRVIGILTGESVKADELSKATLHAAQAQLRELASDESFSYPFWLLVRLSWASRSDDFARALADLGIPATTDTPGLTFVSMVADRVRAESAPDQGRTAFGQIASLALTRTLNEEFKSGQYGLFDSTTGTLQQSIRELSKQSHFERASQRYFGDFLGRTLTYFIDRESANSLGASRGGLATVGDTQRLMVDIDRHAHESALILRKFAGDWYRKHQWESKGEISREEAHSFVAHALRKLRSELRFEAQR